MYSAQEILLKVPNYSNDGSPFVIRRRSADSFTYCSEAVYWNDYSEKDDAEGINYVYAEKTTLDQVNALV